ncbi:LysR family transcriptional regulator [Paenibacillus sp. GSMTC-2017]|uniref:LysR family transcriptional regulator n=1 Tax=Paenibacillus sp. GSMTC-2017 TaxID=2794350 RepID=UPI0018D6892C|nr:LysR family transcriptional regulator [Paenibacillus sp. GSMTC-2017]MBH5317105.1 LysR family transcriptional regulator [Paenibacillus sp. GSMTC-2017]
MDLIYFQTFREVAIRQSFTRAAEELGYAQSSVTTQIQKLEKAYNVQLFERFGRGLRLTSAGEELLKIALQMLDLYQQSKETLTQQGGGTLSIGTIDSLAAYYLPPLIQQIRQKYPDLVIRLQPDRETNIVNKVREGELDIGLILDNKPSDPALEWTTIKEEPLVLIANPGHPLSKLDKVGLDHLSSVEWIMTEDSCNYRIMLEKILRANRISYRIGLELGNPEAIKRCVMAGSGISLLPKMVAAEEIRRGELKVLPFEHSDIRLDLQMVIHPKKWMSHSLAEFIDLLKDSSEVIQKYIVQ